MTFTPPAAPPAWRRTAPRARYPPPTTARSTRSCASRTARPWTSASSSLPRRIRADTPTRLRRTPSAPTRFASSKSSTISPARATTFTRRPREHSGPGEGRIRHPADRGHGANYDRRPQGLRRLHHAGHGVPQQQCHRHSRSTTSRRASTPSWTARTTTAAAASTTATPRPTAAPTAPAPWKPPIFGTSTAWGSGNGPGPWIMADMEGGVFSGYNAKKNAGYPTIDSWRFVTAVVDGGGGNKWDLRGGNAQQGGLTTFYSGIRPGSQQQRQLFPDAQAGSHPFGHRRRQRQRFIRHLL